MAAARCGDAELGPADPADTPPIEAPGGAWAVVASVMQEAAASKLRLQSLELFSVAVPVTIGWCGVG